MQNENSETLVIASIPENINSVELYIDRILKMYNIDDELYGNVLISVIEGANNAITHGNNCDVSNLYIPLSCGEFCCLTNILSSTPILTPSIDVGVDAPDNTIFVVVATIHGLFFVVEMA